MPGHRYPLLTALTLAALLSSTGAPALAQAPAAADPMAGMPGMGPMAGMDHGVMAGMAMAPVETGMAGVSGSMGFHPYRREAISGTAWQPDSSPLSGLRLAQGPWLLILDADLQGGVSQGRGYLSGVAGASARFDFDNSDVVQLRVRASPDATAPLRLPLGAQPIRPGLDELSASFSHRLDITNTLYAYAAVVGSPSFGPPPMAGRLSNGGDPPMPLGAADLDPSEAAAGVVTAGWVHGDVRLEASAFNGRPPSGGRIGDLGLNAWAGRVSFNPAPNWSLQASYADGSGGKQDPRGSASALYTRPWLDSGWWSAMASFGWSQTPGRTGREAWSLESAVSPDNLWIAFARAEQADLEGVGAPSASRVALGAERDIAIGGHLSFGLGGDYAFQRRADVGQVFVRLRVR